MQIDDFEHLDLSLEEDGRILLLRLSHGKANEMGRDQLVELERLTQRLEAGGPQALITWSDRVSSRGTRLFVAGANVTERAGWDAEDTKEHVRWQRRILANLRRAPVFHLCLVDGVALGWGTEYLLTADYRLAGDHASFGLPETGLGIVPGAGGTSELWAQIGPCQALRLGMTGERVDADEAHRIGLVQERVPDNAAGLARARELARLVARRSPTAVAAFKRAVLASIGLDPSVRVEEEARAYALCVDTGEAALGRQHFSAIRRGEPVPWGPRVPWHPLG